MSTTGSETTASAIASLDNGNEAFFGHIKVWNRNLPQPHTQDFSFFSNVGIQRTGTAWNIVGDAAEQADAPTHLRKPFSVRLNTKGTIGRRVYFIFDENEWVLSERDEIKIETQGDTEVRVTYIHPSPGQGPDGSGAWILQPGTIFTAIDRQ